MSLDYLPLPGSFSHFPTYNPFDADLSRLWPEVHQARLHVSREAASQFPPIPLDQSTIASGVPRRRSHTFRRAPSSNHEPPPPGVNISYQPTGSQSSCSPSNLSNIPAHSPTAPFPVTPHVERKRRRSSTLSIPSCRSPAYKMFKCTLDPHCEMEFTRAEHLARHERKHTKEKPFKCHCSKSFSRLDNWRQHKISVHKNEVEENSSTEERLIKVHKDMQRQNNIRKAVTIAAQQQGRIELSPSGAELASQAVMTSPYSTQASSLDGSRRQSDHDFMFSQTPVQLGAALMLLAGPAPPESPTGRIEFGTRPAAYSPMTVVDHLAPNGALSPLSQPYFPLQSPHQAVTPYYLPGYPVFPAATNLNHLSPGLYNMMTPSSGPTSSEAAITPQSQPTPTALPTDWFMPQSTPQRSFSAHGYQSDGWAQGMVRKRDFVASLGEKSPPLDALHKRFKGSL